MLFLCKEYLKTTSISYSRQIEEAIYKKHEFLNQSYWTYLKLAIYTTFSSFDHEKSGFI